MGLGHKRSQGSLLGTSGRCQLCRIFSRRQHPCDGRVVTAPSTLPTSPSWMGRTRAKNTAIGSLASLSPPPTEEPWPSAVVKSEATESKSGEIVLWDVAAKEHRVLTGQAAPEVWSVAISPNGQVLATGTGQSGSFEVQLWDVPTGKLLRTLAGHTASVWALAFSPDGRTLASADWGRDSMGTPDTEDLECCNQALGCGHRQAARNHSHRAIQRDIDGVFPRRDNLGHWRW